MREITKEVKHTVDGREMTFQITKMNALHGTYLMKFCAEKILPAFAKMKDIFMSEPEEGKTDDEINAERTEKVISILPEILASLSEDDLMKLETRCLQTVRAVLPAGLQPVMIGSNFGISELEYDIITALVLCYEVIEFNLGGFFGENSLGSLLPKRST